MESFFLKKASGRSFNLKLNFFNFLWLFAITFLSQKVYQFLTVTLAPEKKASISTLGYYTINSSSFLFLAITLLIIALYALFFKKIEWADYDRSITVVSYTCLFLLAWNYLFYGYNYFINHWDLLDRLTFLVTILLALYNPSFLILATVQALLLSQQFRYPLFFDYSYTDKSIVFSIIISSWLYMIVKSIFYKAMPHYLYFIILIGTICNWYWLAGLGKLELGWVGKNELYKLFLVTVDYNWLYFMNDVFKNSIAEILKHNNTIIQIGAIILELVFPLIILINKRTAIFVLVSFAMFHLLVFFLSGIFFWKWIVVEIVVMLCLKNNKNLWLSKNRNQILLLYFVFLIASPLYFSFSKLAWFDSGIYNKYEFKVKNDQGEVFALEPSFFAPYDLSFAQNRFDFVNQDKIITSTFGSTIDGNILSLGQKEEIVEYVNLNGKIKYNPKKIEELKAFLRTFIVNKQNQKRVKLPSAPAHIWQGPDRSKEIFNQQLDSVFIIKTFRYINNDLEYIDLDKEVIKFSLSE